MGSLMNRSDCEIMAWCLFVGIPSGGSSVVQHRRPMRFAQGFGNRALRRSGWFLSAAQRSIQLTQRWWLGARFISVGSDLGAPLFPIPCASSEDALSKCTSTEEAIPCSEAREDLQSSIALEEPCPDVEFRNVSLVYGSQKILDDVSFSVRQGEAVALLGPSGTGKSTILKLISGLLMPSDGDILVRGVKREKSLKKSAFGYESAKIALVFQNPTLFDSLSVAENVGFELLEHSSLPESEIADLVEKSLARVGIEESVMYLLPDQLSGGMQKRVSFARAVTFNPKDVRGICRAPEILLLDEPTAGLDPVVSTRIEDLVRRLQEVCPTCILVTHSYSTVRRTVDRVLFLHDGRIRWDGPVSDVDSSGNPFVEQFFSASLKGPMQFDT